MGHKYDEEEFNEKQQSKQELNIPHAPLNSIETLRNRISLLENVIGIK